MKRIEVDFNSLNSTPIDIVKLGVVGINDDELPPLKEGERVILYDDEFEVEATIIYDVPAYYWMAQPYFATWKNVAPHTEGSSEFSSHRSVGS